MTRKEARFPHACVGCVTREVNGVFCAAVTAAKAWCVSAKDGTGAKAQ